MATATRSPAAARRRPIGGTPLSSASWPRCGAKERYIGRSQRGVPPQTWSSVGKDSKGDAERRSASARPRAIWRSTSRLRPLVLRLFPARTEFLTRGLRIVLTDDARARTARVSPRRHPGLVAYGTREGPRQQHIVYFEGRARTARRGAMHREHLVLRPVYSFANNIKARGRQAHLQGFRSALTRTLNNTRAKGPAEGEEDSLEARPCAKGAGGGIPSTREPAVRGQTKTKLGTAVDGLVERRSNKAAEFMRRTRRCPPVT